MKNHRIAVDSGAAQHHGIKLPKQTDDQSISPNEAARILGVTGEAVKVYIYKRKLPAIKLRNGYWRILKRDLEQFIRSRLSAPVLKVLVFPSRPLAHTIAAAVEKAGREPVTAFTVPDALLKAADAYPAMAVIDLATGDDGWSVAERLRRLKNYRSVPVLLIAPATLSDADVDRALAIGAKAVLTAPVSAEKVTAELESVMARL